MRRLVLGQAERGRVGGHGQLATFSWSPHEPSRSLPLASEPRHAILMSIVFRACCRNWSVAMFRRARCGDDHVVPGQERECHGSRCDRSVRYVREGALFQATALVSTTGATHSCKFVMSCPVLLKAAASGYYCGLKICDRYKVYQPTVERQEAYQSPRTCSQGKRAQKQETRG